MTVLTASGDNLSASRYDSYADAVDRASTSTALRQIADPGLRHVLEQFDAVGSVVAHSLHKLEPKHFSYNPFRDTRSADSFTLETGYSVSPAITDHGSAASRFTSAVESHSWRESDQQEMTVRARSFGVIADCDHVVFGLVRTFLVADDSQDREIPWPDEDGVAGRGSDDAVVLVEDLASRTGLPVRDILKSADIKRSSFYSWKKQSGLRPRIASQGSLWSLAQVVEDLEELLRAPARAWILADPERRMWLLASDHDKLLSAAVQHDMRWTRDPDRWEHLSAYSVGADQIEPTSIAPPATQQGNREPRKVRSAQVRNATHKRGQ